MPLDNEEIFKPAVTEKVINKPRKTLLEYLPEAFKATKDSLKGKTFDNLHPNSVALAAKVLDEVLETIANDWETTVDDILQEFRLNESLAGAEKLYSIRQSELIKGFFLFKGTMVDVEYILRMSGYKLQIIDYEKLTRTDLSIFGNTFSYNKQEDRYYYYIGAGSKPKPINNCELYAIIYADLTDPKFPGYSPSTLEAIKKIIASRLLVCVYLNRMGINFHIQDIYNYPIKEIPKSKRLMKPVDDYQTSEFWDMELRWDNGNIWDNIKVIDDDFRANRKLEPVYESVFISRKWDDNVKWDLGLGWDSSFDISDKKYGFKRELKDVVDSFNTTAYLGGTVSFIRYSRDKKITEQGMLND